MIIIGCGYVGRLVTDALLARSEAVTGIVRGEDSARTLAALGAEAMRLDLARDDLDALRCSGERVFHFAPPPGQGTGDAGMVRLLESFSRNGHPRRLVYMSTTGVYGDCQGSWVDEARPANPRADRSLRRWDAEQQLRRWSRDSGAELVILRVAGIYACDRLPIERIRSAQPVVSSDEAPWSNRIHADDLVQVCLAAMQRAPNGALYNVCDGSPSTMTDYFCRIADAAGLPRPPQIPLSHAPGRVSAGMLSYLSESRRLSNRRMLDELKVRLRFPTLADGLADCFPRAG